MGADGLDCPRSGRAGVVGNGYWPRAGAALIVIAAVAMIACDKKSSPPRTPAAATAAALTDQAGRAQASTTPGEPQSTPAAGTTPPPPHSTAVPASPAPSPTPRPARVTLTPLGHLSFDQGFNANVWEYNGFAYVGTYGYGANCPATGIKIVDVHDPAQPQTVGSVAAIAGTSQEDVRVRHVTTAAFTGDLLAAGIQRCGTGGQGGVVLYDVTNPIATARLGFFATGAARGVHELDLIQQGDKALALLAVPYSESYGGGGDFRIVDVSDPRNPKQIAQWGVGAALGADLNGGIGCSHAIFDHSARASVHGKRVYLSWWDEGVIVLDISDPASPRLIGHIQYPPGEEGETHSVAEADGGKTLLIADEDGVFEPPLGLHFRVQTADGQRDVYGCESLFSKPLVSTGTIDGRVVAVGSACPGQPFAANPAGSVALVDAGNCTLADRASRLAPAGALAMIAPTSGEPVSEKGGRNVNIPIVTIRESDAAALHQALAGGGGAITLPSQKHSSGLRVWDIADISAPRQIALYQTPDSTAFPPPGNGAYTIHNSEVAGNLAFLSWYTDGLRVVDISDPSQPREVASYVPPAGNNPRGAVFPNQPLDWGVHIDRDLIYLSDINTGLYVLRYYAEPRS